jgi:GTP pyrophosphokinase
MIEKELKKQSLTFSQLFKPEWVEIVLRKYTFLSLEDIYAAIGYGTLTANKVISRLREEYRKTIRAEDLAENIAQTAKKTKEQERKRKPPENGVIVKGIENCLVRISKCCNPVPGDDIVGYITRGRGVSVHRKDCLNVTNTIDGDNRLIEVSWYTAKNVSYNANITVMANDRTALLMEITNVIGESKIPLKAINARTTKEQIAIMSLTLEITNTEQLEKIIKKLRRVESVFEVTRGKN